MPTLFHISDMHFGAEDAQALDRFAQRLLMKSPMPSSAPAT
jgi:hypothetical protein